MRPAAFWNFYPRSPCGERRRRRCTPPRSGTDFYPRSPCGERRTSCGTAFRSSRISIHALLAESDFDSVHLHFPPQISIHALLAESDHETYVIMEATKVISIHALLAESDLFLRFGPMTRRYFYPRSPCGERRNTG